MDTFIIAMFFLLYLLPTIIASGKKYSVEIATINILFGWTGIGWGIALIWALISDR